MKSKILIVEDEAIEAMSFEQSLNSFGYDVVGIVSTGEDVIGKVTESRPDLVLMDIILKGELDGIDAATQIKENFDIPVIYLTAHPEESTVNRAKLTSPYGYLIKPVNRTVLKNTIDLALYKHDMESKLKKSEDMYRSIMENLLDAYFRGDKEGKITMASPSAAKMYGYDSPQEMMGIPAVYIYKSSDDRQKMLEELKNHGKVENMEVESLRKDGSSFWVSMNAQYLYDQQGMIQGTEAFIRDISETKKAEKELEKRETYYRTIFDHTGTATVIIEEDTTISRANAEFLRLSGFSREEIEGKKSWTDFVVKEDLDEMLEYHRIRRLDPAAAPIIYDFRFINKEGKVKNIHLDVDVIPGTKKSVASLLDITERKNAMDEIQKLYEMEREARDDAEAAKKEIFTVLGRISDSFVALDKNWNYSYVNKKGAEHFGKTPEEMVGKHIWTMFPEGVGQPFYKAYYKAMEEQEFIHLEEYYPPYDRWFENDIYPSEDGITIFFRDITEQINAAKKLERSEQSYRAIFENSGTSILTFDNQGTIIIFNSEWEKVSGYSREEIEGKRKWMEFVHPDYLDKMLQHHKHRVKDPELAPPQYETVFIKKNGEPIYMYITITALPGTDKWLASATDITEMKVAQKNLEKNVLRFRALAEYNVDGIITTDAHGYVLYYNKSFLEIFGYSKEQIKNSSITILMPERYREKFKENLRNFQSTGEHRLAGRTIETIGLRKDGEEFPFEMSLTKWEIDEEVYFTSIIRDITSRKKYEDNIKKALKEKETLLKEIHHRVKNNLQIISSLLDLQEGFVKEDHLAVNVLKESQNRVLSMAMLHEMLYQSKDLSHINFVNYINNLVSNLFQSYHKSNTIHPVIDVDDVFLNIETAVPCGLIISELVSNSLKYGYPQNTMGEILISLHSHDNYLELIISDDGVGFPEDLDFRHIKSSLGLNLVNTLIKQLDGTIDLDTSQGTRFTIKFEELEYKKRI